MSEADAKAIQGVYGGRIEHSGGNHWHCVITRNDGRVVVFSEDGVTLYPSLWLWERRAEECETSINTHTP